MSKTVDELIGVYIEASNAVVWEAEKRGLCPMTLDMQRAGIAAVVRALRDEIVPERMRITRANDTCTRSSLRRYFNEILGDAGEKVAIKETAIGAVLRMEAGDPPTPATDPAPVDVAKMQRALLRKWRKAHSNPAPAVCVWTQQSLQAFYNSACGLDSMTHGNAIVRCQGHCPSCGKPIAFKGA